MTQYIDKAAVAAELKRRIKTLNELFKKRPISWPTLEKLIEENKKVLSFLDTLEVKDVELEKEIKLYKMRNPIIQHREDSLNNYMSNVAKHFFELGLKAQKGE